MRHKSFVLMIAVSGSLACGVRDSPPGRAPAETRAHAVNSPGTAATLRYAGEYRFATPGRRYEFPRDHASHPEFQSEWWYYTGQLASGRRAFGYQLTIFRVGLDRTRAASVSAWAPHTVYFAHLAVTDVEGRRYVSAQRVSRPALGLAGADTARYRAWVGDWTSELSADGIAHRVRAATDSFGLDLRLDPLKPPVIHGRDGVSRKAAGEGHASHYVSITRLATRGRLFVAGDTLPVVGESWMDHEFGTSQLGPDQIGWDWFSLQLDDGRELMLYVLRRRDGSIEPLSSGTLVERDGRVRHLERGEFSIETLAHWASRQSGGRYPARWRIRIPALELELAVEPRLADQELRTPAPIALAYWEGAVQLRGTAQGRRVGGFGYVELTGYAGPLPGF
ncbi:MAG: carotenoid 1,2-hydratase [Candidatus Eisenbacteria bacterium]|uniref:Carotenoid 1,2-hydratase n=1 Tax=Eiseniibacteriota bacterium TaxID=2212470 RepID=A0A849SFT5_UNCEI|nr:carotenoid 1,2-hydratase [Candidatus Eisenbacteria bacterium]